MADRGGMCCGVLTSIRLLTGILAGSWMVACGSGDAVGGGSYQVRDSAGVEIVESVRPAWEEGGGWRVGSDALLRIGVVEGDPTRQFTEVSGAVRLVDGTVVVADGGSQEVRFFGADGEHLGTVGRPGEGPGEFTGLSGLGIDASGQIWAYDFSLRRITWMNRAREITGLVSLGLEPAMLNPVGALPGDIFLLKQLWGAEQVSAASKTGFRRDPIAFVRFDATGTLVDTLGLFPGRELVLVDEGGRGVMSTPPFARNSVGTIRSGRVVVGSQERFELQELAPDGTLLRVVRRLGAEEAAGPEELEAYIQGRLKTAPPERHPSIRRSLEEMPTPETLPAYGAILGDEAGGLWVGEWTLYPDYPSRWSVFGETGGWLGEVRVPQRFYPHHIGPDWILGVEQDELDVEYVVVYPLIKDGDVGM